ncbi:MAG: hypothetical protein WAV05_11560 [Anaerolineales bacterium]
MNITNITPRSVKIIRWIARIWSIPVLVGALFILFIPDSNVTEPVPVADWFLLSLWGIAILGLLIAWRWELIGGIITVTTMFIREVAWVILKGPWLVNFLIVWAFVLPPALLFLIAWRLERKAREAPTKMAAL